MEGANTARLCLLTTLGQILLFSSLDCSAVRDLEAGHNVISTISLGAGLLGHDDSLVLLCGLDVLSPGSLLVVWVVLIAIVLPLAGRVFPVLAWFPTLGGLSSASL